MGEVTSIKPTNNPLEILNDETGKNKNSTGDSMSFSTSPNPKSKKRKSQMFLSSGENMARSFNDEKQKIESINETGSLKLETILRENMNNSV